MDLLFTYLPKNKESLLDEVNGLSLDCSIMAGYMQHLNSANGNKMEEKFRELMKSEGVVFVDEPLDLLKYKKFDHFIEYNGEYYGIEQKQKDNHDHRKDIGEFTAIREFPDEYCGKKINKFIWFVSKEKGKTSKAEGVNILRGEEMFKLFFKDEDTCSRLYNKLVQKSNKTNVSKIFDLDENYKEKINFVFNYSGKKTKDFDKYVNNEDYMKCVKALSKKNKFYDAFIEQYENACGVINFN